MKLRFTSATGPRAAIQMAMVPAVEIFCPGLCSLHCFQGAAAVHTKIEPVNVDLAVVRTAVTGIRVPGQSEQTIRPDAPLLLVAGAGWTKKQADGATHVEEAESIILGFLHSTGASLGGSKSLVDQSGEGHAVLPFMTHLNQIGQTGSSPRHRKGLATCCHGEEPHTVGWRGRRSNAWVMSICRSRRP